MKLRKKIDQQTCSPLGVGNCVAQEEPFGRSNRPKVGVEDDVSPRPSLRFEIPESMRLACPSASVKHLVIDALKGDADARVDEGLTKLIRMPSFGATRDSIERAIDR